MIDNSPIVKDTRRVRRQISANLTIISVVISPTCKVRQFGEKKQEVLST